ncbi:MAG: potassium channel family protein [Tissierella sp.]|uniref:potassium channel family protein n=1 Tax=Tissierella sp. TaxID=41274 RepID=UPI003F9B3DE8
MENKRNLGFISVLLISLLLTGTIGYKILLEVNLLDALYMTVITISTVGYAEIAQMDVEAKIFSIFLIFTSLGTVGYLFSSIVSSLLEGDLKIAWRKKRMERDISKLENHYIICGAGETGINAIKQFQKTNSEFVVIEKNEEKTKELVEENILVIQGDSTHDIILERARVSHAKGLISTLPSDADNVYTVLTARSKNSDLYIVSRAIEKNADEKLKRAGADNTISPNEIGGSRMAALILRPTVISFLDVMTHAGDVVLDLEDVVVTEDSSIRGKTLMDVKIPEKTGLIILAIRKGKDDKWIFNPNSSEVLKVGDVMVVLGTENQVEELRKL